MTMQVNLLPQAYRLRCQQVSHFKRWLAVCGLLVVVLVFCTVLLCSLAAETWRGRRQLSERQANMQVLSIKTARLAAQQREFARQQQLADRLGRKHRWSEVLASIAEQLPETMILTGLESIPSKGQVAAAASGAPRPKSPAGAAAQDLDDTAKGLVITGTATDHESIAAFMRALNGLPQLGRCYLEATNRQTFRTAEGVTFTIRMRW